jgi:hypothetical protein
MEPGDVHFWVHSGGGPETLGQAIWFTPRVIATSRDDNGVPDDGFLILENIQYERHGSEADHQTFFDIRNASPSAEILGYSVHVFWSEPPV